MTLRSFAWLVAVGALVGLNGPARSQDIPADDALERILEKAGAPGDDAKAAKPKADSAPAAKPATDAPGQKPATDPKKPGRAGGTGTDKPKVEDEALDSLLEKLGETGDEAKTTNPQRGGAGGEPKPPQPPQEGGAGENPDDARRDPLDQKQKQVDEHLEELTGRIRRKKQGDQDPQSGAMSQTIRKIREVEKKLGDNETGDQVRQKQQEIVKEFDQLIEQAKKASSKSRGQGPPRQTAQNGKPGEKPGQDGNTGMGTQPQAPRRPTPREVLAQNKDEWGHLPPELRAEMENVFSEAALPLRKELIDRYYISVNRKSTSGRGDSR